MVRVWWGVSLCMLWGLRCVRSFEISGFVDPKP